MFEFSSTSTGLLENREWSHDLRDFLEIGKDLSRGGVLGTIQRRVVGMLSQADMEHGCLGWTGCSEHSDAGLQGWILVFPVAL